MSLIKFSGKPIEKLIDVCKSAIGTWYKPRAIKKEADAEAYRIIRLEEASGEAKLIQQEYKNRIDDKILYREASRLKNIDKVIETTYNNLSSEINVSDTTIDKDWLTRFFVTVEDISNEEMQNIWAKILAGEIKRSGSFSLRTLDTLKNLTKREAEIFSKAARLAISHNNGLFIFKKNAEFLAEFDLQYLDILNLVEAGLIQSETGSGLEIISTDIDDNEDFVCGDIFTRVIFSHYKQTIAFPVLLFTQSGKELHSLIDENPPNRYMSSFEDIFSPPYFSIKHGKNINNEIVYE